ncbi:MAG: PorV/PorQ family protein [Ignavibacteriales bacterium]|nr:PorV/PorQ family protein [Ignavibacteriales bacterium]
MNKIKYSLTFLLILFVTASTIFGSGGNRNGTAGATQLLIPVGARSIGLSGSTLTTTAGVEALYWNPANVVRGSHSADVMFSQTSYIADIGVTYGAITANIEGFGAIGFSIKTLAIGDIEKTTVDNPDGTGSTFSPQFVTVGLTYSTLLSDRISVGITANLITEQIDLVSATGFSFNAGVTYNNLANIDGLSFAVVMKNIGPQMRYDGSGLYTTAETPNFARSAQLYKIDAATFELPSTLEMGLGYQLNVGDQNSLAISTLFQNNNFDADMYKIGAEYNYDNLLYLRGGYTFAPELSSDERVYGFTVGGGLKYVVGGMDFRLDYAFQDTKYFDGNNVITIGIGL